MTDDITRTAGRVRQIIRNADDQRDLAARRVADGLPSYAADDLTSLIHRQAAHQLIAGLRAAAERITREQAEAGQDCTDDFALATACRNLHDSLTADLIAGSFTLTAGDPMRRIAQQADHDAAVDFVRHTRNI
ncbi:hypothetical protein [Streptacidiphilus cavernicola]|uniref:Uncharacterized protein n=1 Tax=Streptacidiphilus cavernicola TaxID=3342716 RepID=A0ABV6VYG9_9ACTN